MPNHPSSIQGTPPPLSASSDIQQRTDADSEVDPAVIEALSGPKERIFVLKLGENMEALVLERK